MHSIFRFFYICLLVALLSPSTIFSQEVSSPEQIAILEAIAKAEEAEDASGEASFDAVLTSEIDLRACDDCVFGYDLFRSTPTTFALSSDVPVPPSYTLGPGDELRIEYYGNENLTKKGFITRTGTLHLPLLGPVTLAGLTFSEAEDLVTKKVGIELIGTDIFMTLSKLRSINIYVLGAAYQPGTYTISALSTLTNALFTTGGVSQVGSVRNIQVKRKGKVVKTFDLYDLLLKGDTSSDTRLQQGDTIFIPLITATISIQGSVLRPGNFEIKVGERLKDVLAFSGDIRPKAKIELNRMDYDSMERKVSFFSIEETGALNLVMRGGDSINVAESISLEAKNVLLTGEFHFPGYYSIMPGDKLYDLIVRAGGYTEEAYTEAAVFTRVSIAELQRDSYAKIADTLEKVMAEKGEASRGSISAFIEKIRTTEPTGRQVIEADLLYIKTDPKLNLTLQADDTLFVPQRPSSITVVGEVLNAASHIYDESLSIEDYIDLCGGFTEGADKKRIYVVLPNGQSVPSKLGLLSKDVSNSLLTGSIIVVSRDTDPINWYNITSFLSPLLADLAITAAALAAIQNY